MSVDLSKMKRYAVLWNCIEQTFVCDKCEYGGCTIEHINGREEMRVRCFKCKYAETVPSAVAIRKAEEEVEIIPQVTVEQEAEAEVEAFLAEINND